jgi:mono/diheme cytochrome c family protein
MWALRVPALLLAAGLTISPSLLHAQATPEIALPPGDAARGKAIFESSKGNCQSCHRVNGVCASREETSAINTRFAPFTAALDGGQPSTPLYVLLARRGSPPPTHAPAPYRTGSSPFI